MTKLAQPFLLRFFAVALLLSVRPLTTAIAVIIANHGSSRSSATESNLLPDASKALVFGRPLAWLTHQASHSLHFIANPVRFSTLGEFIDSIGREPTIPAQRGFPYHSPSRAPPR
jgi:hypothetical protein